MFDNAKDNMILVNPDSHEEIVFHHRSWLCMLFGILTHYLRYSQNYAKEILEEAPLCREPLDFHSARKLLSENEYHWVITILTQMEDHCHNGFDPTLPVDFQVWRKEYIAQHGLNPEV